MKQLTFFCEHLQNTFNQKLPIFYSFFSHFLGGNLSLIRGLCIPVFFPQERPCLWGWRKHVNVKLNISMTSLPDQPWSEMIQLWHKDDDDGRWAVLEIERLNRKFLNLKTTPCLRLLSQYFDNSNQDNRNKESCLVCQISVEN